MVSVYNAMTEQMLTLLWWDAAFGNIFSKSDPNNKHRNNIYLKSAEVAIKK